MVPFALILDELLAFRVAAGRSSPPPPGLNRAKEGFAQVGLIPLLLSNTNGRRFITPQSYVGMQTAQ